MAKTKKVVMTVSKENKTSKSTKSTEQPVENKKIYSLSIGVNEYVVNVETDNLFEALQAYPVPAIIKTEMLVTVTKGNKVRDITLKTFESRRIFGNRNALEMFADKLVNLVG